VNTLTLDRVYAEATVTMGYQIYRSYYAPPEPDFLRYMSITNIAFAYSIVGKYLTFNQEQLNRMDPQRGSTGDAYILSSYKTAADGTPVHELWPRPRTRILTSPSTARGIDLTPANVTPTVDLPATLSTSLLMARAEYRAALWAAKNVNRYADLKGINWFNVRKESLAQYNAECIKARRQDFEIFKNTFIVPKGRYLGSRQTRISFRVTTSVSCMEDLVANTVTTSISNGLRSGGFGSLDWGNWSTASLQGSLVGCVGGHERYHLEHGGRPRL